MEDIRSENWNLESNIQLKEKLEGLQKTFSVKQNELKDCIDKIDKLNTELRDLSKKYNEIKTILNKREGK